MMKSVFRSHPCIGFVLFLILVLTSCNKPVKDSGQSGPRSIELKEYTIKTKIIESIIDNEILKFEWMGSPLDPEEYFYIFYFDEKDEVLTIVAEEINQTASIYTDTYGIMKYKGNIFLINDNAKTLFNPTRKSRRFDYTFDKFTSEGIYDPFEWMIYLMDNKYEVALAWD